MQRVWRLQADMQHLLSRVAYSPAGGRRQLPGTAGSTVTLVVGGVLRYG